MVEGRATGGPEHGKSLAMQYVSDEVLGKLKMVDDRR